MKKLIIALALIGISWSGAEAQTKSEVEKPHCKCVSSTKKVKGSAVAHIHHHPGDKAGTYQVCTEKNGYYNCCMHHKTVAR